MVLGILSVGRYFIVYSKIPRCLYINWTRISLNTTVFHFQEIALIVQALLGDRRFTFRNDQHVLCGSIIGMLIIWLHLLVSTE
uniref:Uncharacterized protein n=1 Tax=Trichobilharzia regenti TaxID=157069 RepID=A0AA85K367_TRIRE